MVNFKTVISMQWLDQSVPFDKIQTPIPKYLQQIMNWCEVKLCSSVGNLIKF